MNATPTSATATPPAQPAPGARTALSLLLAINLFNYIDRQVLSAVLPKLELDASLFSPTDPWLKTKLGSLTTAFMVSYMLLSPVFGWLGDRRGRWVLVGVGVILWSLASGGTGLATTYWLLLLTRCFVGVGEAAYGPVAPSMLSDMYPLKQRGKILSYFYLAIPVGSALGFVIGGQIADTSWGWRGAFLCVMLPGLLLGAITFLMKETRATPAGKNQHHSYLEVVKTVITVPSYRLNTLAATAITFVLGGVAAWVPAYIFEREARFLITSEAVTKLQEQRASDQVTPLVPPLVVAKLRDLQGGAIHSTAELKAKLAAKLTRDELEQYNARIYDALVTPDSPTTGSIGLIFGGIVVISGLVATILGGIVGDMLRERYSGAYFLVSGTAVLVSLPFFLAMLFVPFPYAWVSLFLAVFGLFFNTGPSNTILANVIPLQIRATAFAINILVIHAFGDAISPVLIGAVADRSSLQLGFALCSILIVVGGVLWLLGAKHLQRDMDRAPTLLLQKSDT